jgi:hypothetical protein
MKKIKLTESDLTKIVKRIINEAPVDYGDYPERMDPSLERKVGSPESLYAKNPAFRKGAADVERLIGNRFKEVIDRVRDAYNQPNLSSEQVKRQIMMQMNMLTMQVMRIESENNEELVELALELALEETGTPRDFYQYDLTLGGTPPQSGGFQMKPKEKPKFEIPKSFDVDDETDEEQFQSEVDKRNVINLIIQGEAKKGHYSFMKPSYMSRISQIDPQLTTLYRQIMAAADLMYFTMEQMIEMMSQTGQGVAGKVEIQDADEDEDEGGDDEGPDTKIVAGGLIFPILLHEIIKGLEEATAREQFSDMDPERAANVMGQTDVLSNEPMQLRLGPSVVEMIKYVLPDEMFEPENDGLNPWFKRELYKIPAKEFLDLIGDAISENDTEKSRAKKKFTEIMKTAQVAKKEYDDYNVGKDQEDMDDFLASL